MKNRCKCSVCGHKFAINKSSVYLTQETSTLADRLFGKTPNVFNAIDCPNCNCQMLLKERMPRLDLTKVIPPMSDEARELLKTTKNEPCGQLTTE